ncbi:unnamed protein product [Oreochromis niloticus]|nr:unnamed protein product [Mustela putorius furo]
MSSHWQMDVLNCCPSKTAGPYILWRLCMQEQILSVTNILYPVEEEGVARLRLDIVLSLIQNSDDISQLCCACGERSSGAETDEWIECTFCGKWYHTVCVDFPCAEGDYKCCGC